MDASIVCCLNCRQHSVVKPWSSASGTLASVSNGRQWILAHDELDKHSTITLSSLFTPNIKLIIQHPPAQVIKEWYAVTPYREWHPATPKSTKNHTRCDNISTSKKERKKPSPNQESIFLSALNWDQQNTTHLPRPLHPPLWSGVWSLCTIGKPHNWPRLTSIADGLYCLPASHASAACRDGQRKLPVSIFDTRPLPSPTFGSIIWHLHHRRGQCFGTPEHLRCMWGMPQPHTAPFGCNRTTSQTATNHRLVENFHPSTRHGRDRQPVGNYIYTSHIFATQSQRRRLARVQQYPPPPWRQPLGEVPQWLLPHSNRQPKRRPHAYRSFWPAGPSREAGPKFAKPINDLI